MSTFCQNCFINEHKTLNHTNSQYLKVPQDFYRMQNTKIPRHYMELFAVVCIETSHYVTFAKTGKGQDSPWCFFDSMADRVGASDGYNIPEITHEKEIQTLLEAVFKDESKIPLVNKIHSKKSNRFFSDAYMCLYQSSTSKMY